MIHFPKIPLFIFLSFVVITAWGSSAGHSNVDTVIGVTSEPYTVRFSAVKNLLNGELIKSSDQLLDFLSSSENDVSISDSELWTIENNLLDRLMSVTDISWRIPDLFIEILQDDTQNVVWKDYVIQKCPRIMERCDANQHSSLLDSIWNSIRQRKGTIAGTSLLALERISNDDQAISRSRLSQFSEQVAADKSYGEGSRLTALQVASRMGQARIFVLAKEIIREEDDKPILMMVALSVLSKEVSPENIQIIEKLLGHSDFRIRKAAKYALRKMS